MTRQASKVFGPTITRMLIDARLDPNHLAALINRAIEEDLDGGQDVTTMATVPLDQLSILDLCARRGGVIAGVPVAAAVFMAVCGEDDVEINFGAQDGDVVEAGHVVISVRAATHALLRAERPALNFLGHLSGIATSTRSWVDEISGTGAAIRDTRKTTPGLRALEKYAVRCGGGVNHRMSLSDAALVKDNHVLAAGGVTQAFNLVRENFPGISVEVEVDSIEQLDAVLAAGADLVLLDNFTTEQMREAVARTGGRARLEASGGLTFDVAREVAATGVDYLAVGALTHSAPVLDIGADLRTES
ncbi:MAG: carboxylating nicotinate-nucleotide diphosphorylase [Actinobacteria bacterium]|uniref:nicotinate-nucleotide diphosphorylase (carboxylating) n=1 Tax=freshwater metagenome TaxID=449393 RepID=A0A6J7RZZ9_9ZZZZ|nr:carboxylating nicotinate-nucleotide diphosphorylase [Actinomycetota bacterium]MTB27180.1 carboxylating nicotinate-nucleotide diphosphorylase [Actinomycetota bacterium]